MAIDLGLLQSAREAIWCAELGALLHNVGKMHPAWMRKLKSRPQSGDEKFRYELIGGAIDRFADDMAVSKWDKINGELKKATKAGSEDDRFYPNLAGVLAATRSAMASYPNLCNLFRRPLTLPKPFAPNSLTIGDIVDFQDAAWYKNPDNRDQTWFEVLTNEHFPELTRLFKECHEQASGGEKRSPRREESETDFGEPDREPDPKSDPGSKLKGKREPPPWVAATVFGQGHEVTEETHEKALAAVDAILAETSDLKRRDPIRAALQAYMKEGLADARPPFNDVRVSDMGFAAAAFFKAAIAGSILQGHVSAHPQWRMLRICLDGEAYLEQSNRISDLAARNSALTGLFEEIRRVLEADTPLANEIYRDTQGAVYLLPVLEPAELDRELPGQVDHLVRGVLQANDNAGQELAVTLPTSGPFALGPGSGYSFALGELLDQPVPSKRPSIQVAAKWNQAHLEVCTVCGIRPMAPKGSSLHPRRICQNCHDARTRRCREWRTNAAKSECSSQTIWIDELADGHGRAALISARFRLDGWLTSDNYIGRTLLRLDDPTAPRMKSPSFARLARVFETARDFWAEARHACQPQPRPLRLLLKGPSKLTSGQLSENVSYLLEYRPDFKTSVVYLGNDDGGDSQFVVVENQDRLQEQLPGGSLLKQFLTRQCSLVEPTGYGTPDKRFGTFFPASCSTWGGPYHAILSLLDEPGRMWLFCPADKALERASGLYELYTHQMSKVRNRLAMDIGIAYFPSSTPVRVAIDAARRFSHARFAPTVWTLAENPDSGIRFTNGVTWLDIPKDPFFTNFESPSGQFRRLAELKAQEAVRVEPSHFDFAYLEQSAARFELVYNSAPGATHYTRRGGGLRPHPLERLPEFTKAWELLRRLSTSQIKMLDERIHVSPELWPNGRDETHRWFAEAALREATWPPREIPTPAEFDRLVEWSGNGVLEDVIEIRLGIEKQKDRTQNESPSGGDPAPAAKEKHS